MRSKPFFKVLIPILGFMACKPHRPNGIYLAYKVTEGKHKDTVSVEIVDSLKHLYENENFELRFNEKYVFLKNDQRQLNTSMPREQSSGDATGTYRYSAEMDYRGNRTEYILRTAKDTVLTIVTVDCNPVKSGSTRRFGVIDLYLNKTDEITP